MKGFAPHPFIGERGKFLTNSNLKRSRIIPLTFTEISSYLNMNFTKGWYTGFMKVNCGFIRGKEYTYGTS